MYTFENFLKLHMAFYLPVHMRVFLGGGSIAIFSFFKVSTTHNVKIHCSKAFAVLVVFSLIVSTFPSLGIKSWETNSVYEILGLRTEHKENTS